MKATSSSSNLIVREQFLYRLKLCIRVQRTKDPCVDDRSSLSPSSVDNERTSPKGEIRPWGDRVLRSSESLVSLGLCRRIKYVSELFQTHGLSPERASIDHGIELDQIAKWPLTPEQFNILIISLRSLRQSLGGFLL